MKTIARVLCASLLLLLLPCLSASGPPRDAGPSTSNRTLWPTRQNVIFWYDDVESGEDGWTHRDLTALAEPKFHLDSYLAHPSGSLSYWCGTSDPSFAGGSGYGNVWDQRLELPPVHLGGTATERASWGRVKSLFRKDDGAREEATRQVSLPMLTYSYHHDSEPGFDFTWVQAQSEGAWVNLNDGYSGSSGGWQECANGGVSLAGFGDPVHVRFRFVSDGSSSDEDGGYVSDGGAFHADNIRIYDYATGEEYFFDDCEDGVGLCTASVPPPAGDLWHIVHRPCASPWSPTHVWWCGDDADTSHVPGGLLNELCSPLIDISYAFSCTAHFAIHMAVPPVDNDYVEFLGTANGEDYYSFGQYWGDSSVCASWMTGPLWNGLDVGQFAPPPLYGPVGLKFVFHTTDDGCGPGMAGDAGVTIDDIWLEGESIYVPSRD